MKFLKPEIFYPENDSEQANEQIKKSLSDYKQYVNSILGSIPRKLYNAYTKSDRFHDYHIDEVCYVGVKANFINIKSDRLRFVISNYKDQYIISFNKLLKFDFTNDILENNYSEKYSDIEDITLCEIGVINNYYTLEFHTSSGFNILVIFKDIDIERNLKYNI